MNRILPSLAAAAAVCLACCGDAVAGTYKTIAIDNAYADWTGVPVLDTDPADNAGGPDIGATQIANDDDNLYIRNTFHNNDSMITYTALDIDGNPATGFDVFGLGIIGSEAGWQNDFGFAQATGVFNSGSLSGPYFGGGHALLAPIADTTPTRELAISLDAMIAATNAPLFPDDTFTLLFWTDNGFDVSAPISYTLAPVPEPASLGLLAAGAGMALLRRRSA